jgi:hypothetical protein
MTGEKPYSERIWLCEGIGKEGKICPIRERCTFFRTSINKQKIDHWAVAPYDHYRGKCFYFEQKEGGFQQLNITSNV